MATGTIGDSERGNSATRTLQLIVEVEYPEGCPLSSVEDEVRDVEIQRNAEECKVDFLVDLHKGAAEYRIEHRTVDHQSDGPSASVCVCEVFHDHDCLPHVLEVNDSSVLIATYPPDRERASALLSDLQEVSNSVGLVRLHTSNGKGLGHFKEVDLSRLSEKQLEAVERANASDFFEPGGTIKLEDLAEETGITASAYSQRLSRAKTEIFRQLFGN